MELKKVIEERRSVRSYKKDNVPEDKLKKVLESARLAPSASNRQPWKFIVVKDPQRRKELARAASHQSFVGEAPVVIAAVGLNTKHIMGCGIPSYPVDLAIAIDHITLAAADEGLGTCWIGSFSQEEAKKILKVPDPYKVVTLLPLGFPADRQGFKSRKSLEEVVCYETFEE